MGMLGGREGGEARGVRVNSSAARLAGRKERF